MAKKDFTKKLRAGKKTWSAGKDRADQMFTSVDPGVYEGVLQSAEIAESQSDNLRIKREHLIEGGEFDGVVVYDGMNIGSDVGAAFAQKWIDVLGFEVPDDPAELPELLEDIMEEEPKVRFKVSHSGDFTNVRVLELIGATSSGTAAEEEEEGFTMEELEDMDADDLEELVEDEELDVKATKRMKRNVDSLRKKVAEALGVGLDKADDDAEEEEKEEKEKAEPTPDYSYDSIQGMKKSDLRKLIKNDEIDVKVSDHKRVADLRDAVCEALGLVEGTAAADDDDEVPSEDAEELLDDLREFCVAWDFKTPKGYDSIDDIDSVEELKELIDTSTYPEDQLMGDEVELLEKVGLENTIERSKPKKRRRTSKRK